MDAPAPFSRDADRLTLDGVAVEEIAADLDVRCTWLVSLAALDRVSAGHAPTEAIDVGRVGAAPVLARLARRGWIARAHGVRSLAAARRAGFTCDRIVVAGAIKDDGLVKDALAAGVDTFEWHDAAEHANARRIAEVLGLPAPRGPDTAPEARVAAPVGTFVACGGLLARVLGADTRLALDAPCVWGDDVRVSPVASAPAPAAREVELTGLSSAWHDDRGTRARLDADVRRGDWVVVSGVDVVLTPLGPPDHEPIETTIVDDGRWARLVEPADGEG